MIISALLAGFVPLLQVTFIVIGRIYYPGSRCERSGQTYRIAGCEIDLLIAPHTGSCQIGEIGDYCVFPRGDLLQFGGDLIGCVELVIDCSRKESSCSIVFLPGRAIDPDPIRTG